MLDSRASRLAALTVLLGAFLALAVRYGTLSPAPELGYYPTADHVAAGYDAYVGDRIHVTGTVVAVDPVVIAAEYAAWVDGGYRTGTIHLTVTGLSESVAPGETLQVFGVARPDRTVRATNAVAVPAANFLYMYAVSVLGGLWVFARLVRGWTVAWGELAVRRRPAPISLTNAVAARLRAEDPADA